MTLKQLTQDKRLADFVKTLHSLAKSRQIRVRFDRLLGARTLRYGTSTDATCTLGAYWMPQDDSPYPHQIPTINVESFKFANGKLQKLFGFSSTELDNENVRHESVNEHIAELQIVKQALQPFKKEIQKVCRQGEQLAKKLSGTTSILGNCLLQTWEPAKRTSTGEQMNIPDMYLGDGVYAHFDGSRVKLCLSEQDPTRVICLDPRLLDALDKFRQQIGGPYSTKKNEHNANQIGFQRAAVQLARTCEAEDFCYDRMRDEAKQVLGFANALNIDYHQS